MLILLPILLLIIIPIFLAGVHLLRPKLGISWFVAVISAFLVWLVILISRLLVPETLSFGTGNTLLSIPFSTTFLLDRISWPYAWAIAASLLAVLLTSLTHLSDEGYVQWRWTIWPITLLFGGVGLWGILAGNLNNLILAWAALDLGWLILFLLNSPRSPTFLIAFTVRICGIFLAIGAVFAQLPGSLLSFPVVNVQANTLLFIGALVRLGSLTISPNTEGTLFQHRGLNTFSNIVLAATTLIVVSRSGSASVSPALFLVILVMMGLVGLLSGVFWNNPTKEQSNGVSWILGVAMMAGATLLQGEVEASSAWGISLILTGSLALYSFAQLRYPKLLLAIGVIGISSLPFTPAWQGSRLYPLPGQIFQSGFWWLAFLLIQALMIAGLIKFFVQPKPNLSGAERWIGIIYLIGLFVLPITQYFILIIGIPGLSNDLQAFPPLMLSWAGLLAIVLGFLFFWLAQRKQEKLVYLFSRFNRTPFENLIITIFKSIGAVTERVIRLLDQILEGDGGMIWTLVFLLLLFALLLQFSSGG